MSRERTIGLEVQGRRDPSPRGGAAAWAAIAVVAAIAAASGYAAGDLSARHDAASDTTYSVQLNAMAAPTPLDAPDRPDATVPWMRWWQAESERRELRSRLMCLRTVAPEESRREAFHICGLDALQYVPVPKGR